MSQEKEKNKRWTPEDIRSVIDERKEAEAAAQRIVGEDKATKILYKIGKGDFSLDRNDIIKVKLFFDDYPSRGSIAYETLEEALRLYGYQLWDIDDDSVFFGIGYKLKVIE
jgi:hypothetical protein